VTLSTDDATRRGGWSYGAIAEQSLAGPFSLARRFGLVKTV